MGFTVQGADRVSRTLLALPGSVKASALEELEDIGEDLEDEVIPVTPFRDGELRASWFDDVTGSSAGGELEAGFEGPRDYLLVQHEGGWVNYRGEYGPKKIENYTTPGTGPKFLERPWLANREHYKQRLRAAVRKGLRG